MKNKTFLVFAFVLFTLLTASPSLAFETNLQIKTQAEIEAYRQANKKTPEEIEAYKQANKKTPEEIEAYKEANKKTPEEIEAYRLQAREEKENLRPTITENKLNLRRQNAIRIANNLVSKLENRFEYLNKIKLRLQTKIDALKGTRDMTEAQTKLSVYNTSSYTANLEALKAKIATINTADKPNDVIPVLREASKLVQDDLKELHQFLVETLKLIVKAPKIDE